MNFRHFSSITTKYFLIFIFAVACFLSLYYAYYNFYVGGGTLIIVGAYLYFKPFKILPTIASVAKYKHFTAIFICTCLLSNILFLTYFYHNFTLNPGFGADLERPYTFAITPRDIENIPVNISNWYIATQTYLFTYLKTFQAIYNFSQNTGIDLWQVNMTFNTIVNIVGAASCFWLIRKMTNNILLSNIVFAVYLFNPVILMFSLVAMPLVIVNAFIMLAILLVYYLFSNLDKTDSLEAGERGRSPLQCFPVIVLVLLCLTIGLGNTFRPNFIILIIALFLTIVIIGRFKNGIASVLALFASLYLSVAINTQAISNFTGLNASKSSSGWSLFLGSNIKTNGRWNGEDNSIRAQIVDEVQKDPVLINERLTQMALDRYKSYTVAENIHFMLNKLNVLAKGQVYTWDTYRFWDNINGLRDSKTAKTFKRYNQITFFVLFVLACVYSCQNGYKIIQGQKVPAFEIFMTLTFLGFIFSGILVEVRPRYSHILYPLFTIFAILALFYSSKNRVVAKP
jgi:hypothetical protein